MTKPLTFQGFSVLSPIFNGEFGEIGAVNFSTRRIANHWKVRKTDGCSLRAPILAPWGDWGIWGNLNCILLKIRHSSPKSPKLRR